jgi:hypothetical protein
VAQLAAPEQAKIDRDLAHALGVWERLPIVEADFGNWSEDAALDFVFEWTLEEDRLHRLAVRAAQDVLTSQQQKRYRKLLALVDRHRPIVERLISA